MKTERFACAGLAMALLALALLASPAQPKGAALPAIGEAHAAAEAGILRLHVVANSDSPEDQSVKYRVRDAVLECEREMAGAASESDAERLLEESGKELMAAVEAALAENGMSYGAQLRIGSYDFPEKSYADRTYPAGEYRALRVVLGEGKGQNWWCVLFPPLCMIELEEGQAQDGPKFESLILKLIEEGEHDK